MSSNKNKLASRLSVLAVFGVLALGLFWLSGGFSSKSIPGDAKDIEGATYDQGKAYLTEFSDLQCPACRAYYPLVEQLRQEFGDKLVFEYKHFPLRTIHKNSLVASQASEASRLQGKFEEMIDLLFSNQSDWDGSNNPEEFFKGYAESIGLDLDKFESDSDSDEVRDKIFADIEEGNNLVIRGTPTFFLNGERLDNPGNYEDFKSLIDQIIAYTPAPDKGDEESTAEEGVMEEDTAEEGNGENELSE